MALRVTCVSRYSGIVAVIATSIAIFPFVTTSFGGDAPKSVSLPEIISAWEARETWAQSLDVSWTELHQALDKTTYEKVVPSTNLVYLQTKRLVIKHDNLRYQYEGVRNNNGEGEKVVQVYTERQNAMLMQPTKSIEYPLATLEKSTVDPLILRSVYTNPVLLHFRPLAPRLKGFEPGHLSLEKDQVDLRGALCSIITVRGPGADSTRIWVGPAPGYQVYRSERTRAGRVHVAIDIYFDSNSLHALPTSWRVMRGPLKVVTGKVTAATVNPISLEDHIFVLTFEPGTFIMDLTGREVVDSVVKPDGTRRVIMPARLVVHIPNG